MTGVRVTRQGRSVSTRANRVPAISTDPRIGSDLLGYRIEALVGRGGIDVIHGSGDALYVLWKLRRICARAGGRAPPLPACEAPSLDL